MLELATDVPELEDSANAAPLLASVVARVLMVRSLMLFTDVNGFSILVLVPSSVTGGQLIEYDDCRFHNPFAPAAVS